MTRPREPRRRSRWGDGRPAGVDDLMQPFHVEAADVAGRLVRLGPLAHDVLSRNDYPAPVAALLGETVALSIALAGALKYDGVFTLQVKGEGAVSLLVADVTSAGVVRGYAQFDGARVLRATAAEGWERSPVPALLGRGQLAFTVDQGARTERYQGIVELTGATLASSAEHYFERSEQLRTALVLCSGRAGVGEGGRWRAAALVLQRLPIAEEGGTPREELEEDWRRALALLATSSAAELLDPVLAPDALLYRLFHQEGVRLYQPAALRFGCRCSRLRVERTLRALPRAEIESLTRDELVVVTCQFCHASYNFDRRELDRIYAA